MPGRSATTSSLAHGPLACSSGCPPARSDRTETAGARRAASEVAPNIQVHGRNRRSAQRGQDVAGHLDRERLPRSAATTQDGDPARTRYGMRARSAVHRLLVLLTRLLADGHHLHLVPPACFTAFAVGGRLLVDLGAAGAGAAPAGSGLPGSPIPTSTGVGVLQVIHGILTANRAAPIA